jgi:tetratricopeptide (TPR) repeat protein
MFLIASAKRAHRSPSVSFLSAGLLVLAFLACVCGKALAQDDYLSLYRDGKYDKALEQIDRRLTALYDKRAGGKAGEPLRLDVMKTVESGKKLLREAYRSRRAAGDFIESNDELFELHLHAGRCFFRQKKYPESLNHYKQALRFRVLEQERDDGVFYEMAQVYLGQKRSEPYRRMLEQAHSLNRKNVEYSRELGIALSGTNEKKKAIYHLERFVQSKEDSNTPEIYLVLGNLYEDIGRYLDTVRHYRRFLKDRPDDAYVHFALGYLAYRRTGNFSLARESFKKSLELLPASDILRRSRANEYLGDMFMKDLEFDRAAEVYQTTAGYQEQIVSDIRKKIEDVKKIKVEIDAIRASVDAKDLFQGDMFAKVEEKGRLELESREKEYIYGKLNAGKVRWNLAESYERMGDLPKAIEFYRKAITYNYRSNGARERIVKLQLKINRGY